MASDLFAAIERERQDLLRRLEHLDRAEQELRQAAVGGVLPHGRPTRAGMRQRAAQHHLDAINDYLAREGTARQADIAKALKLNSGTVSLALRQLAESGIVRDTGRSERGSIIWDHDLHTS